MNKREALLDSLYAFRFLEKFYLLEGVIKEYAVIALTIVLIFPEHRTSLIKLLPLALLGDIPYSLGVDE